MKIEYAEKAAEQFEKLPKSEQKKAKRKIEILAQNPYAGKKLTGEFDRFHAVRAWPYRIIYHISAKTQSIVIVQIEHRQSVYKRR
jgi:addiction module RelE/StbE family toxin